VISHTDDDDVVSFHIGDSLSFKTLYYQHPKFHSNTAIGDLQLICKVIELLIIALKGKVQLARLINDFYFIIFCT